MAESRNLRLYMLGLVTNERWAFYEHRVWGDRSCRFFRPWPRFVLPVRSGTLESELQGGESEAYAVEFAKRNRLRSLDDMSALGVSDTNEEKVPRYKDIARKRATTKRSYTKQHGQRCLGEYFRHLPATTNYKLNSHKLSVLP